MKESFGFRLSKKFILAEITTWLYYKDEQRIGRSRYGPTLYLLNYKLGKA